MKYTDIVIYDLDWNTIKALREWFDKLDSGHDCGVSIQTEASLDFKDAIIIHIPGAVWMTGSYLDTNIIARVTMARMKLN